MHKWTMEDDIIYKYGNKTIKYTYKQIAEIIDTSIGSLQMRKNQYKYLDGNGGLPNASKNMKKIYNKYINISFDKHKSIVESLL